jgi:GDPmannose 4,6-dehydratase
MDKVVCITGITGQDGSYLSELFLEKGYKVYGLIRRSSTFNTDRIDHIFDNPNLKLVYGDLSDTLSIVDFITEAQPNYFINAAAMSHVAVSFKQPEYTFDIDATGVVRCLEAVRKYSPKTKFLQCSTSELFGSSPPPQNENTPMHPRSPYAAAKMAAYWATVNYREAYNLHAMNAITFNHEGPRRGETFVTRKITRAATRIKLGLQNDLVLGNTQSLRDWSHAKDVCEAFNLMLESDVAKDYVISSGEMHSIQEFVEIVFEKLDLDWKQYVKTDSKYFRPSEVDALCGDPSLIKKDLGWEPKYTFKDLVDEMVTEDMKLAKNEKLIKGNHD